MAREVVIVGAGISGLAAAHRFREIEPRIQVTILEATARPGGVLRTVEQDGYLIETSADSFITNLPWALDLCGRLGIDDHLIETDPDRRRAFVVRRGRLRPIPDGLMIMAPSRLWPMVRTPILSPRGKLRMAWEAFARPGTDGDESLASFVRRRFGREAFERLIQPLVSGMYTGDPERLSLRATMPRFAEMERTHGSLIRAARCASKERKTGGSPASGARYSLFAGLKRGMSELVDALVERLPPGSIRLEARVRSMERIGPCRWRLDVEGSRAGPVEADAVILAAPVAVSSRLVSGVDADLAAELARITTSGCAIASLGYRRDQVAHALDGFGFVVPAIEGLPILSGSFSSVKFAGRAPDGSVLIRVFLGGISHGDLLDQDDDTLLDTAHRELGRLLGIRGQAELRHLSRWREVTPQYELGHIERVASILALTARHPGLALAGNAYQGVGIPQCVRSGEQAAEQTAKWLMTEE